MIHKITAGFSGGSLPKCAATCHPLRQANPEFGIGPL